MHRLLLLLLGHPGDHRRRRSIRHGDKRGGLGDLESLIFMTTCFLMRNLIEVTAAVTKPMLSLLLLMCMRLRCRLQQGCRCRNLQHMLRRLRHPLLVPGQRVLVGAFLVVRRCPAADGLQFAAERGSVLGSRGGARRVRVGG